MKVASVLVASLCCLAVAGCTLKGPELRVKPPVEVKVEGGHHDHDRGHNHDHRGNDHDDRFGDHVDHRSRGHDHHSARGDNDDHDHRYAPSPAELGSVHRR